GTAPRKSVEASRFPAWNGSRFPADPDVSYRRAMNCRLRLVAALFLLLSAWAQAEHMIVSGGPSLRRWENLRVSEDQHDRWWGNFIAPASYRMDEIRTAYGPGAKVVWIVH